MVRVHPARATHRLAGEFPSVLGSQCFGQRLSEEQVGKPVCFLRKDIADDFGILGGLRAVSLTGIMAFMSGEFVGSHRFSLCLAFLASALTGIRTEESSHSSVGFNLPGTDISLGSHIFGFLHE